MINTISPLTYSISTTAVKLEITFLKGISTKWLFLVIPVVAGIAGTAFYLLRQIHSKPKPPLAPPAPPIKPPAKKSAEAPKPKPVAKEKTERERELEVRATKEAALAQEMAARLKARLNKANS